MKHHLNWLKKWKSFYHSGEAVWTAKEWELITLSSPIIHLILHLQVDFNFINELWEHPLHQKYFHKESRLPLVGLFIHLYAPFSPKVILQHLKNLHDEQWISVQINPHLHYLSEVHLQPKILHLLYEYYPEYQFSRNDFGKILKSNKTWKDVLIPQYIQEQLFQIISWHQHHEDLKTTYANYAKYSSQGYKVLFSGPPGSGKTLSAQLIAQEMGLDCLLVDMAQILSKYIGESEQKIQQLFAQSHPQQQLLFFDEAEVLFQDRSSSGNQHQKDLSNYLLQKIEQFEGLVILATNLPEQIDPAFIRRFNQHIHFKNLAFKEQVQLWYQFLNAGKLYDAQINFEHYIKKYNLTPAQLNSLFQQLYLKSVFKQEDIISSSTFESSLKEMLKKNGKKYITETQMIEK